MTYLRVRLLAQDERELGFPTGEKMVFLIEPCLELAELKRLRGADTNVNNSLHLTGMFRWIPSSLWELFLGLGCLVLGQNQSWGRTMVLGGSHGAR